MKIQNALVSNIFDRSQRYFAHVTTVTLSLDLIFWWLKSYRNMLSGTGAWSLLKSSLLEIVIKHSYVESTFIWSYSGFSIRPCSNPPTWRIDMADNAVSPEDVLKQHGGISGKNFAKIINEGSDDDEIDLIRHSPYYLPSCLPTRLTNGDKSFSVLSLNSQSILAKFTGLQVMLEVFAAQDIHFHAICIQESWIKDESKLPLVALEGYQCFSLKATASLHGGLITYVDDKYDVSIKTIVDNSNVWEGLFLELNHKIIVDSKTITDKISICNEFNSFFTNIGPKLADKINTQNKKCYQTYLKNRILTSFAFDFVDENDVTKHISMLRTKKSYGHDGISMRLLKFLLPAVIKPLTIVINQSLATGIFPDKLKTAKVMPFFKKDDITLMDNYRPVSLLTSTSKVFEKVVFTQLYEYFDKNNLLYSSQYGFRKKHSTEMAGLELTDRILKDIDNKDASLTIFMDLSKAFDTLDHQILLTKLKYYGVNDTPLKWFSNCLTGRQQYVEIDGNRSGLLPLTTGVPQGSILGPLLFLIYMNDIPEATDYFDFILYADDTSLYNNIQIPCTSPLDINNELSYVHDWLAVNKLSLNVKKTKYMVFHALNKNVDGLVSPVHIDNIPIERVCDFNFLGLNLNENLSWKSHIDIIANTITKFSGELNRLKRFLPGNILRTLYCGMVQSRLTYCILAWGFNYQRLVKIQKRFMRIITNSKYNAHSEPLFKSLELLNIQRLFDLNCLKFVYRFKKGSLPCYFLTFDCIPRSDIHDHDTRYSHLINVEATRTRMAENCIRHHLITILNNTPRCILDKIDTHIVEGFSFFIKRHYLNELTYECNLRECYVCGNWTSWITARI